MILIARKSIQFVVALGVLAAISALPALAVQMQLTPGVYWETLKGQLALLTNLSDITYYDVSSQMEIPVFDSLGPFVKETTIIFITALIISLIGALLYANLFYRSGRRVRTMLKQISQTLEMVPDLFWIIFSQFLAITIYKTTGFDRIEVAGGFAEYIRFLPIVSLTLTTLFFFIKWLTAHVLETEDMPYLELARAKGIRPARLFWSHLLPNMIYRFYLFVRSNLITLFSSLMIIEYLFNVQGLFRFAVYSGTQMPILLVILLVIYIPIFIVDVLAEWLIPNAWKGGV